MKQLNHFQCPNILRLENFKLYPTKRTWRCYLELCPYGDLARLLNKGKQKKKVSFAQLATGMLILTKS
jgi:hypothetical protein